jgi:hypothetical protein
MLERMVVVAEIKRLEAPAAPNLPIAPTQYTPTHFDVLNNVFRLYFNRLGEALKALFGTDGGRYIQFPHIAASYYPAQEITTSPYDNVAQIVQWNSLAYGSGFTLNANNTATAQQSGVYKITYSLQFANTDNAAHNAIVWLRVNGDTSAADVPDSTTIFSIPARKSVGAPGFACGYSEVVFQLNAGDSMGLWWGTTQAYRTGVADGVYIYSQATQTTPMAYPQTPSAIGSITFVSALPA